MRKILMTTALIVPMSFGAAFAQTATTTAPADQTTTADTVVVTTDAPAETVVVTETAEPTEAHAAAMVEQQQGMNELRLDWLTGSSVYSMTPEGEKVGDIRDVIMDVDSGQIKAAIIGVGGFLGIGEKQIAVAWDDLTINYDANQVTTTLTREEADAAPAYVFRDRESAPAPTGQTAPATTTTTEPAPATTAPADPAVPADHTAPADPAAPVDPAAPAAPATTN
ncbi:MAG: PRC-barrel domain-containing protein [Paracoccus sp. (in: a-proteobacteria)]|nr:PRC-barrel domain-containing protein [Paracoccus sp. (in: a-proteobacteria)]